jgi:dsRNA-specific ribonuclease
MNNISLLTQALTTPSSQLLENNERLESYGSSLISLIVLVELYLTRDYKYLENDLDTIRKQRI